MNVIDLIDSNKFSFGYFNYIDLAVEYAIGTE